MNRVLGGISRLSTARPWATLLALLALTVLLGWGATLRAAPTEGADLAFLPPEHRIAVAAAEINRLFRESGDVSVATLLFRGEALTPGGLAQMSELLAAASGDPAVAPLLTPVNPVVGPAPLVSAALGTEDLGSLPQAPD